MPLTITNPDMPQDLSGAIGRRDYNYEYPRNLDLKPGSPTHQRILARVMRYAFESARVIRRRHPAWEDIDEKLTAFIHVSEKEKEVKQKDPNKPISIVFPYSYAILETLISYMVAAFLPEPIFRYEGSAPEDIVGATLMQQVINLHVLHNKVGLNLHTMFRDAGAYGIGVVSPMWVERYGKRMIKRPRGVADVNGQITVTGYERHTEENALLFEGNGLSNIDPYRYLPDPAMPLHAVQRGEYVGWMDRGNFMDLLSQEQLDDNLFNVRYLQFLANKTSAVFGVNQHFSRRVANRYWDISLNRQVSDPVDLIHMNVKLIPAQWNLGRSSVPEKWLFTIAGDSVIIRAQPLELNHDYFPVALCAPDFDGYSPVAYSRLEMLQGMQVVIDWLFNAHITNVRKAINDLLIVDPYLLNIRDLENPGPGGLVRLRRPAWGKQLLDHAVKQLNVVDITANNMRDVAMVIQYMQQIGATDNPVMGNLRKGGPDRLTGTEFEATSRGAVSRLERIAKIIGIQAFQDIGLMFASHTQQFMSQETYVRASGDWPQDLQAMIGVQRGRAKVDPMDVLVDYDLLVRDGSIPGGNYNDAWTQIFKIISESPQLLQQFDIVRIFEYIATNLGAKNVDNFRLQPRPTQGITAPDEDVMSEVQRGNLIPIGQNGHGGIVHSLTPAGSGG